MSYNELRNLLAPMKRGEVIEIPHPEQTIEVTFSTEGVFQIFVHCTTDKAASCNTTVSLKKAVGIIQEHFKE